LAQIGIFASGNLDERRIQALVAGGAPIDGFGIGTSLDVSEDCPALDCVYKLQEYADRPRRKRSSGKATWPGAKQVYRTRNDDGTFAHDILTLATDAPRGEPLLVPVLRRGEPIGDRVALAAIREYAAQQLAALPPALRALDRHATYGVEVSASLSALAARVDAEFPEPCGRTDNVESQRAVGRDLQIDFCRRRTRSPSEHRAVATLMRSNVQQHRSNKTGTRATTCRSQANTRSGARSRRCSCMEGSKCCGRITASPVRPARHCRPIYPGSASAPSCARDRSQRDLHSAFRNNYDARHALHTGSRLLATAASIRHRVARTRFLVRTAEDALGLVSTTVIGILRGPSTLSERDTRLLERCGVRIADSRRGRRGALPCRRATGARAGTAARALRLAAPQHRVWRRMRP
jgi:hypothetical protein